MISRTHSITPKLPLLPKIILHQIFEEKEDGFFKVILYNYLGYNTH